MTTTCCGMINAMCDSGGWCGVSFCMLCFVVLVLPLLGRLSTSIRTERERESACDFCDSLNSWEEVIISLLKQRPFVFVKVLLKCSFVFVKLLPYLHSSSQHAPSESQLFYYVKISCGRTSSLLHLFCFPQ